MRNPKLKIFVLDDDRYYGMFLKNGLKNEDFDIHYFQNEEQCIHQLKIFPDILILDHHLEKTTGFEILDEVKRQCKGKTQVIYLSAQEHLHVAVKALKEGAFAYVEKSGEVINSINEAIMNVAKLKGNSPKIIDLNELRKTHLTINS